jgi:hypothetical protein
MDEYLSLGHMQPVPKEYDSSYDNTSNKLTFFIPHHAVYKESSTTTITRVVCDASAKSTTGVSLNDIFIVGPTIQQDFISIILRFRMHLCRYIQNVPAYSSSYRRLHLQLYCGGDPVMNH